ncbi:hypothetical protein TpMuguga_01g02765 [Theileria parva strain Muguga]|uniref:uncharacterized protein n=1 Tax=Theileria parva strain Muguga TaxID=333668 RepID=UPI001C61D8C6|nr:uncharacterized protein TpMuguga_01g02765 [Theileria parva strain Muguga]EAN33378.2 hypothetical protein TpMuguga_01g02765 [Theileria parva strain Muguga]
MSSNSDNSRHPGEGSRSSENFPAEERMVEDGERMVEHEERTVEDGERMVEHEERTVEDGERMVEEEDLGNGWKCTSVKIPTNIGLVLEGEGESQMLFVQTTM